MRIDRQVWLDNDYYQFAVLAWWILSGADPFGEGVPKDPTHDRIYRMEHNHFYWNVFGLVTIPTNRLLFLEVARGRWGKMLQYEVENILNRKMCTLPNSKDITLIRDHGFRCQNRGGNCTLYVHPETTRCPYCGHKFV